MDTVMKAYRIALPSANHEIVQKVPELVANNRVRYRIETKKFVRKVINLEKQTDNVRILRNGEQQLTLRTWPVCENAIPFIQTKNAAYQKSSFLADV
jgi:hypothetical protein